MRPPLPFRVAERVFRLALIYATGWFLIGLVFDVPLPPTIFVAGILGTFWGLIDMYATVRDFRRSGTLS